MSTQNKGDFLEMTGDTKISSGFLCSSEIKVKDLTLYPCQMAISGYTFYPRTDVVANGVDLGQVTDARQILQLKEACDKTDKCNAFTTTGTIKSIPANLDKSAIKADVGSVVDGIYLKNDLFVTGINQ